MPEMKVYQIFFVKFLYFVPALSLPSSILPPIILLPVPMIVRTQTILAMIQQLNTLGERMVRYVGVDPGLALYGHREYPYYFYKSEHHKNLEYMCA